MKCPNCGAEMKEGTLYCEHCGEDIHIVPDFEPEIEYNMEQTLHDIAREMTPEEDATDDQDAQQSMTELQDWDEEPLENTAKHPFPERPASSPLRSPAFRVRSRFRGPPSAPQDVFQGTSPVSANIFP